MKKLSFLRLSEPNVFKMFGGEKYWEKVSFKAQDIVVKEGDETRDFYFILSGEARVHKHVKEGEMERELAVFGPGEFFGENALISSEARGATVEALSDLELYKLSSENFAALLKEDPEAATGILIGIVQGQNNRLTNMNNRLLALYEMSEISKEFRGNPQFMMHGIFAKLSEVLGDDSMVLFGMDGLPQFSHPNTTEGMVMNLQMKIPDMASRLAMKETEDYISDGRSIFLAVRNFEGKMIGVLTVAAPKKGMNRDIKFLMTVAEQMGHILV